MRVASHKREKRWMAYQSRKYIHKKIVYQGTQLGIFEGRGLIKKGHIEHFLNSMCLQIIFSHLKAKEIAQEVSGLPYCLV